MLRRSRLRPKYNLPAQCLAYAGDYSKPRSWKLPYLLADGVVDANAAGGVQSCTDLPTTWRRAAAAWGRAFAPGGHLALTRLFWSLDGTGRATTRNQPREKVWVYP